MRTRPGTALAEWAIVDRGGFADLRLGDERDVIRKRFGEFRSFRRTADAPESDQFMPSGLMVTYGDDQCVTCVEVPRPAANPTLRGVPLVGRAIGEVAADLAVNGIDVQPDSTGAVIVDWGVGLYAPYGVVEAVSIGA
ncbi:MAG: hypothetical protein ABSG64_14280 [Solirubrobacteraceae bacterium]